MNEMKVFPFLYVINYELYFLALEIFNFDDLRMEFLMSSFFYKRNIRVQLVRLYNRCVY